MNESNTTSIFLCTPEMDFTDYLRSTLRDYFMAHRNFFHQLAQAQAKSE